MAYAYNSNIWGRIRPKIQQWESVTGRKIPPSILREWIDAELDVEAKQAQQSRYLDIQAGYLDLAKEKASQEESAYKMSGIGQLVQGGAGLYGLGKEVGLWGGAKTVASGAQTLLQGTTGLATGAQSILPTASTIGTSFGAVPAMTEAIPATTGAIAPTPGLGLSSLALPALAAGAIGLGGGLLGKAITGYGKEGHMGGERYTSMGIGAGTGALGGFLVGGPVGAIIGGIVGLFGGGK